MTDLEAERLYGGRPPSEDQRAAIEAPLRGRHAIDAGAGTGKTTTLAYRALRLIASGQIRADQLLVVTFTRKAAAEIGERIIRALDGARAILTDPQFDQGSVTCVTIHALAARILAEFAYANGYEAPPRPLSDGEARALFDDAVEEAFADASGSGAPPIVELESSGLRAQLATFAFELHERGIGAGEFEARALTAAGALAAQPWGHIWRWSRSKRGARAHCDPKVERTVEERREEAEFERRNVRWIAALLRRFDERLRAEHAATYGMLLAETVALLQRRAEVARALRDRWSYVLIDEFQDTTAMQLTFLHALLGDPDHPERALRDAMVVGDVRQAIYGFNGADDRIMRAFARDAHGVYRLERNRRSREQIVRAAHAALASAGAVDDADPVLEAVRGRSADPCVFVRKTGDALGRTAERVEEEAEAIAAEIARLLKEGAASSDVALLLRKRTHAHRYVAALARRAIPVTLDRRTGLLETPEVRDARAWLRLTVEPNDALALVRVLQSPQLSLADAALARVAAAGAASDLRGRRSQRFVAAALDGTCDPQLDGETRRRLTLLRSWLESLLPARSESAPLALRRLFATVPIVASYAADVQAEQRAANLRAFEVLAQRFAASAADARLPAFVRYLERSAGFDEALREASLDADGVAVMTVHQAKGLEWPVVFVAGVEDRQYKPRHRAECVRYDERTGALVLTRDQRDRPTLRAAMEKCAYDETTGEASEIDEREERALREAARVFYVALTRARDRLYVCAPSVQRAYAPLDALVPYAAPWPAASLDGEPAVASDPSAPSGNDGAQNVAPTAGGRTRRRGRVVEIEIPTLPNLELAPPRVSFSALATFQICPRRARYRYRLRLPENLGGGPRFAAEGEDERDGALGAVSFGRLVHVALQRWAQARIDGEPIVLDDALNAALAEFAGVTPRDRERAAACARHAVAALEGLEPLEAEAEFTHAVSNAELFGVIDLVARDRDGTLHVIDYKTGSSVADEHYALQLDLYARAARERYGVEAVRARLLRLTENGAEFRDPAPGGVDALERVIRAAGSFTSDAATPGEHCALCPYDGSPCDANRSRRVRETRDRAVR